MRNEKATATVSTLGRGNRGLDVKLSALVGAALLAGCTAPVQAPPAAPPSPKQYMLRLDVSREEYAPTLPDRSDPLVPNVATLLTRGRRVGILPPDRCLTTQAGVAANQAHLMRMECGVLISSLEVRLAQTGYQVVSWQVLKPAAGQSGIDRARDQKLDILFEIDQFSAGSLERMSDVSVKPSYFALERGGEVPLEVSPETRKRCRGIAKQAAVQARASMHGDLFEGVLSAKAVEVSTGTAVWYYQKSLVDRADESSSRAAGLVFDAQGHYPPRPPVSEGYNGLQSAGGVLFGLGLAAATIGTVVNSTSSTTKTEETGSTVQLAGLAGVASGVVMLIVGNGKMGRDNKARAAEASQQAPTFQKPSDVVCATAPRVRRLESEGQSKLFDSPERPSGQASRSTNEKRTARVTNLIADDFAKSLKALVAHP
jgi:hypothetical protein